jgi:phosphinothricin acetyltransferase
VTTPDGIALTDADADPQGADARDLAALYATHVLGGTATFELDPPSPEAMADRVAAVQAAGLPWLLARDGASGRALGYAYAGSFRSRPAYRHSVEDSVYLAPEAVGRGLGRALLAAVIERCEAADVRQMIAVITTPGSEASEALHRSLGFTSVGHLPAVGRKHGRWLGTLYMQRAIGAGDGAPPADEPVR